MSMLAEPRRKTSWVLNPRNTHWTADTSKLGLRLMEKMGWSQGSGLGANAQGSTEHIKVAVRSDNRGVGFKDRAEDELLQQLDFAQLLQQLGSETPPLEAREGEGISGEVASLEEKSQKSRSRVHYRKFTRGKDLTLYSEKDLANILGKPASKKVNEQEAAFQSDVATVGGGCMLDYFRKKMADSRFELKHGDSSASEEMAKENEKNQTEINIETNDIELTEIKKEKKKLKKQSKDCEQALVGWEVKDTDTEVHFENKKEKRHKVKRDLENCEQGTMKGLTNSEMYAETKKEKKRKRKVKKGEDCEQVMLGWEVRDTKNTEVDARTKKEEKQKRKAKKALKEQETFGWERVDTNAEIKKEEKQTARKASENCEMETVQGEVTDLIISEVYDVKTKKEKKQKVKKLSEDCEHEAVEVKNVNLNEEIVEIKKERKRKHKKVAVEEDGDDKTEADFKLNVSGKKCNSVEKTQASDIQLPEAEENKTSKKTRELLDHVMDNLEVKNTGVVGEAGTKKRKERKCKSNNSPEKPQQGIVEKNIVVNEEVVCEVTKKEKETKRKSVKILEECVQNNLEINIIENEHSDTAESKKEKKHKRRKRNPEQNIELNEGIITDVMPVKRNKKMATTSVDDKPNSADLNNDEMPKIVGGVENYNSADLLHQEEMPKIVGDGKNDVSEPKKEKKHKKRKRNLDESIEFKKDVMFERKPEDDNADLNHQKAVPQAVPQGEVANNMPITKKEKKAKKIKRKFEESTELKQEIVVDVLVDGINSAALNHQEEMTQFNCEVENNFSDLSHQEEISKVVDRVEDDGCSAGSNQDEISRGVGQLGDDYSADNRKESLKFLVEVINDNKSNKKDIESESSEITVVELNGIRYLNGICNYDLPCPFIGKKESVYKIQVQSRDTVKFSPILGANNENFCYVGLKYQTFKM